MFRILFFIIFVCFLFWQPVLALVCFQCNTCTDFTSCKCNNTVSLDTKSSYCVILREKLTYTNQFEIRPYPRNSTKFYAQDPHYIYVEERIHYSEYFQYWFSESKKFIYACQTDRCNRADLLVKLPINGLLSMLPTEWLRNNLQRKRPQDTTRCRQCMDEPLHTCSDAAQPISADICNQYECQTSCRMSVSPADPEMKQVCYDSFCSDFMGPALKPSMPELLLSAVFYIDKSQLTIVEVDITCNAKDCTQFEIFQEIRNKIKVDFEGIKPFMQSIANNASYPISKPVYSSMLILLQILYFSLKMNTAVV